MISDSASAEFRFEFLSRVLGIGCFVRPNEGGSCWACHISYEKGEVRFMFPSRVALLGKDIFNTIVEMGHVCVPCLLEVVDGFPESTREKLAPVIASATYWIQKSKDLYAKRR
jgi:hypothetical protein